MSISRARINQLFELWARWCVSGSVLPPSGASILSKMVDNRGLLLFASGGAKSPNLDCIEADIERALSLLFVSDPTTVKVLRFEYLGRFKREDNTPVNQLRKAASLGMSIRTYERRLSKGRRFVIEQLRKSKQC